MPSVAVLRRSFSEVGLRVGRAFYTMYYVDHLRSLQNPTKKYIGYTTDFKSRFKKHNEGGSIHTRLDRPWEVLIVHCFKDKQKAIAFEKYLKTGSGNACEKKRFW